MKKNQIILTSAVVLLLLTAILTAVLSFGQKREPVSRTEFMLDTICTVTLYDWDGDAKRILDESFSLCDRLEQLLSTTVSSGDIYRINHSGGESMALSPITVKLITDALNYSRISDGAFDITIYPVKQLWDFSGESADLPSTSALSNAIDLVDYTKLRITENTVTLPKGMGIDLGAIAKGFAADQIAQLLRETGVRSAVIDLGGNVYVIGSRPDGSPWRVGIQQPFASGQAAVIEVTDASVVTSGVYQRYFEKDGQLYHHILDAHTGMPCDTGLYSVTIIAENSELCDALSTVCMLTGYDKAVDILRQYPNVQAVFVTSDNKVLYHNKGTA